LISKVELQQIQNEGQQNENACDPLGQRSQLGVCGLGLALAEEGLGTAADNTGQAGILARLHGDNRDQSDGAQQLNSHNDISNNTHDNNNLQKDAKRLLYIQQKIF